MGGFKYEGDDDEKSRFVGTTGLLTLILIILLSLGIGSLLRLLPVFTSNTIPAVIGIAVSILIGVFAFDFIRKLLVKAADAIKGRDR